MRFPPKPKGFGFQRKNFMNSFLNDEFRNNASKLHKRIFTIVKKYFPAWKWEQEKAITVKNGYETTTLYVDICSTIPMKIAIECHGRQHQEYVEHFHKNILAFKKAIALDKAKKDYLIENGYAFVEFIVSENLTERQIIERILEKMREDN